ncbi:uncharacterized protein LOC133791952 [Humulus lupulus]|uniref:uncharacterized protein LOC133791952 n=1 Tax=Humulus lupulus TaxID=3486 RepID=UPI002B402AE7|nr:uncharacterized protein LOC133791952 [Humulus lupulus]
MQVDLNYANKIIRTYTVGPDLFDNMMGISQFAREKHGGYVTFGDGNKGRIMGKGKFCLQGLPPLGNVLYVEGSKAKLISVSQIYDEGCMVLLSKTDCTIISTSRTHVLTRMRSSDNCYLLITSLMCNATKTDDTELWHYKLGHLNYKYFSKLVKLKAVRDVPNLSPLKDKVCGPCQLGKQVKSSHLPLKFLVTSQVLELLHVDFMGPMHIEILMGKRYVMGSCLSLQAEKGEKVKKVIRLQCDHGKEFENNIFADFCNQEGIAHKFSAPKTPQQNGVVERKNITLQEMAHVMLNANKVSKRLWAKVVNTTCYISNMVHLHPGTKQTSYELWKDRTPNLVYVHVFCCKCYILNDREKLEEEEIHTLVDTSILLVASQTTDEPRIHQKKGPPTWIPKVHPLSSIVGNPNAVMVTQKKLANEITNACHLSSMESKSVKDALKDEHWIYAMQDELQKFDRNELWALVPRPLGANIIGTKWIFRNKTNEVGNMVCNKARLVAQGYTHIEGVDFEEMFAPVARLESIRLLLVVACYMKFKLYQMNAKSAFLNGILVEEAYVSQPPGFEDPHHGDHVYKLNKDLYGLKQAPRAWYDRLTTYLLENGYTRGNVDQTLFIKPLNPGIVCAQIYVDDIAFGSACDAHTHSFVQLMTKEFEMGMVGELSYFLGFQIKQLGNGIFLSQSKYAKNMLKILV